MGAIAKMDFKRLPHYSIWEDSSREESESQWEIQQRRWSLDGIKQRVPRREIHQWLAKERELRG